MGSPPWEADGMDHHTSPLLPPRGEMGSPSHRETNALRKKREASSALNGSVLRGVAFERA